MKTLQSAEYDKNTWMQVSYKIQKADEAKNLDFQNFAELVDAILGKNSELKISYPKKQNILDNYTTNEVIAKP